MSATLHLPAEGQAYSAASPLYIGNSKIWSRTGIQQGPLSSLLCSPATDSHSSETSTDINVWYHDDDTIGRPLEQVGSDIEGIGTNWSRRARRSTAGSVRQFSWEPPSILCALTPRERCRHCCRLSGVQVRTDELQLLGAPICDAQMRAQLLSWRTDRAQTCKPRAGARGTTSGLLLKNYIPASRLL